MDTLDEAVHLARRGDMQAAIRVCETRLVLAQDDVEALSLLADICTAGGHHERAAALLTRMIALRPSDAAIHRRLAGALLSEGRAEAAAVALRAAILIEPENARAHNNLG
jgi:Flp pilus assembly protein TadD